MPLFVKDIMSSPAHAIEETKTAQDAAKFMRRLRRGFLIVTRKGKPSGVISDSDIVSIVAQNKTANKVKIKELTHSPIVSVQPDEEITSAVRKMKANNIHRLPVIRNGKLVGVISLTDIAKTSPEMADLLEYRLKMKEQPFELKEKFTVGICENCGNYSNDLKNIADDWICDDCREETEE